MSYLSLYSVISFVGLRDLPEFRCRLEIISCSCDNFMNYTREIVEGKILHDKVGEGLHKIDVVKNESD